MGCRVGVGVGMTVGLLVTVGEGVLVGGVVWDGAVVWVGDLVASAWAIGELAGGAASLTRGVQADTSTNIKSHQ